MPGTRDPYTDPDTIRGLYQKPNNVRLLTEIAMLTGAQQLDAVNAALATQSIGIAGVSAAEGSEQVFSRFKVSPDIVE